MALTDRTIQTNAKPAGKPFKLTDGHGPYLLESRTAGVTGA
ncbi:MAG TPA: hypothetical protein VHK27_13970 [Gammaproteobacteria bacterium]|nr:hypothetical protein [Gammaproteobacteria bacterium]